MARSVGYGRSRWMDRTSVDLINAAKDKAAERVAMEDALDEVFGTDLAPVDDLGRFV